LKLRDMLFLDSQLYEQERNFPFFQRIPYQEGERGQHGFSRRQCIVSSALGEEGSPD